MKWKISNRVGRHNWQCATFSSSLIHFYYIIPSFSFSARTLLGDSKGIQSVENLSRKSPKLSRRLADSVPSMENKPFEEKPATVVLASWNRFD